MSPLVLRARKLWAWIVRLVAPGSYGSCFCCGISWWIDCYHRTPYTDDGSGCFALCEFCWSRMTPAERLPFYETLMAQWRSDEILSALPDETQHETQYKCGLIRDAVLAGK